MFRLVRFGDQGGPDAHLHSPLLCRTRSKVGTNLVVAYPKNELLKLLSKYTMKRHVYHSYSDHFRSAYLLSAVMVSAVVDSGGGG